MRLSYYYGVVWVNQTACGKPNNNPLLLLLLWLPILQKSWLLAHTHRVKRERWMVLDINQVHQAFVLLVYFTKKRNT